MSTPGGIGPGKRAGLTREAVIDQALAMIESQGPDALSMRRLASEFGVSTNTIYWHIGSREELINAIIEQVADRQAQLITTGETPFERVLCVAKHLWQQALENRNVTSLAHQTGLTAVLQFPLHVALTSELTTAGLRGDEARDAARAILMCLAGFLVVAFRAATPEPSSASGRSTAHLWANVDDATLDAATRRSMQTPPDLGPLFERTVAAVIGSFVAPTPGR